jgi:hypothetical protein
MPVVPVIPLTASPNQTVDVTLAGQYCRINIYQKSVGLFLDLYVNDTLIIGGVLCLNRVKIVRDIYLGFIGELAFIDTQGNDDPNTTGLGTRFILAYIPVPT